MQFCDPNQRLRCSARGAPSLLPLLQGTLRDSEQGGKLCLCQAGFQTRPHDGRTGLSRSPFATASLDFTHAVQDLLPDVAVRLESGERTSGEFLSHVRNASFSRFRIWAGAFSCLALAYNASIQNSLG